MALHHQFFAETCHHRVCQSPESAVRTVTKALLVKGESGLGKDCKNDLASIRAQDSDTVMGVFERNRFVKESLKPSHINTPLKPFNAKRSVKISYLITAFQRQPQPQEIDLREGGENLRMLKQSPTYQLSPLLCALKKYLTSYKGSKFVTEGDVVSNSVCASLASSELVMLWAQWSLPCYTKSQS
ncbi:hypothetical protein HGM15179_006422 [Zosterops borbonicus]|uniref:Uncharacterized protein n=1 Tax=Zosterops borbonicus TaxID=364589 RepID=A0A8K1GM50_9PASS|nr:hypothetical protein HGM15179_006422 [Zosterops borbonicus]